VFPVRYELEFYIPEEGILHSHRRECLKSYFPERNAEKSLVLQRAVRSQHTLRIVSVSFIPQMQNKGHVVSMIAVFRQ
jgi:hypothetical protein